MNLAQTIDFIYAGGPGSGPNAPCPQCGPHSGKTTAYREGDKVKILKPVKTWNEKTWERKIRQPGAVARVQGILPAMGHNPEMLKLKFGKHSSEEHVPVSDVMFHKAAGKPLDPGGRGIRSRPIPEEKALMRIKLPSGGRYGLAKPAGEPRDSQRVTNWEKRQHPLKGQFEQNIKTFGFADTIAHPGMNLKSWVYEAKKEDGGGTVIWLHRYSDQTSGRVRHTVIGEVDYAPGGHRFSSPKEFSYNNPAKAFKTLHDRYGIWPTAREWRYTG